MSWTTAPGSAKFPADPGLTLPVYTAESASPTQDALNLPASWPATLDQHEQTSPAPQTDRA